MEAKHPTFCPKCQNPYNLSSIPLELPCGHSFCERCLTNFYSSDRKFLCFADDKTYDLTIKDLPVPNFYRIIVKENLATPNQGYFLCSKHKNEAIKFICEEHSEFLCSLCIWDHAEHKSSTQIYQEEDLLQDIKRVETRLMQMQEILTNLKVRLEDIRLKKINQSVDIKTFFNDAEKMLIKPFCKAICEEKVKFPLCMEVEAQQVGIIDPKLFLNESVILPQAPNKEYLQTQLGMYQTKLLFRATRDGFKAENFWMKCMNKGPTLVLVKSKNGYYFAGFNSVNWDFPNVTYKAAPNSCLLSLNNKTRHEIFQNHSNAMYNHGNYGPTFGGGHDLYISSDCNQNTSSYSDIGSTYSIQPHQYSTDQARNYFAGSYKFQVEDYEMDSRVSQAKVHFFEHLSIERFSSYLRSAFQYSTNILFERWPMLVHFRYFQDELLLLLESLLQSYFLRKYNSTYSEYFYGYTRKNEKNTQSSREKLLILVFTTFFPYIRRKMEKKYHDSQMALESPIPPKKALFHRIYTIFFRFSHSIMELTDFLFNLKYLLSPNTKSYSPSFFILTQHLEKLEQNEQEPGNFLVDFLKKYFVFALFLATKFFDWYFQPANNSQKHVDSEDRLVRPPFKLPSGGTKFNYCQLCNKEFRNPTCLSVSGYVFCFTCIEEYVKRHGKCPISQLSCSLASLHKIYKS